MTRERTVARGSTKSREEGEGGGRSMIRGMKLNNRKISSSQISLWYSNDFPCETWKREV